METNIRARHPILAMVLVVVMVVSFIFSPYVVNAAAPPAAAAAGAVEVTTSDGKPLWVVVDWTDHVASNLGWTVEPNYIDMTIEYWMDDAVSLADGDTLTINIKNLPLGVYNPPTQAQLSENDHITVINSSTTTNVTTQDIAITMTFGDKNNQEISSAISGNVGIPYTISSTSALGIYPNITIDGGTTNAPITSGSLEIIGSDEDVDNWDEWLIKQAKNTIAKNPDGTYQYVGEPSTIYTPPPVIIDNGDEAEPAGGGTLESMTASMPYAINYRIRLNDGEGVDFGAWNSDPDNKVQNIHIVETLPSGMHFLHSQTELSALNSNLSGLPSFIETNAVSAPYVVLSNPIYGDTNNPTSATSEEEGFPYVNEPNCVLTIDDTTNTITVDVKPGCKMTNGTSDVDYQNSITNNYQSDDITFNGNGSVRLEFWAVLDDASFDPAGYKNTVHSDVETVSNEYHNDFTNTLHNESLFNSQSILKLVGTSLEDIGYHDANEPLIIDPANGGWIYYQLLYRVSGTTIPAGDLVLTDVLDYRLADDIPVVIQTDTSPCFQGANTVIAPITDANGHPTYTITATNGTAVDSGIVKLTFKVKLDFDEMMPGDVVVNQYRVGTEPSNPCVIKTPETLQIRKIDSNGTPITQDPNLPKAKFEVYAATDNNGTWVYGSTAIKTLTIDPVTGISDIVYMLPGEYGIKEVVAPDGYTAYPGTLHFTVDTTGAFVFNTLPTGITVDAIGDPNGVTISVVNTPISAPGKVQVAKVDNNGNAILASNDDSIRFMLKKLNTATSIYDDYRPMHINSGTNMSSPEDLPPGKYALFEVSAPSGYVLSSTPIYFEVTNSGSVIDGGGIVHSGLHIVNFVNIPKTTNPPDPTDRPEPPGPTNPGPTTTTTNPPLVEITEAKTPAGLPDGYTLQQQDEDSYVVFDENDVPLGQVDVPEGKTISEIDIIDEMTPFGKPNPKTYDENNAANIVMFMTFLTGLVVLYRKRRILYNYLIK